MVRPLLAAGVCVAACVMGSSGRGELVSDAGSATRPAAAVLPKKGEPGWDSVFDDFVKSGLPQDIPVPDKTPYDGNAAKRDEYLLGYKMGFVEGVQGMWVSRNWYPRPEVLLEGEHAGDAAGGALHKARERADVNRRLGFFETGKAINERSPAADRRVWDDFRAFRGLLQAAIKEKFPRNLQMSDRENEWRVFVYPYDDYSGSNSGAFVRRTCYKGECTIVLSVTSDAAADAKAEALKGRYDLKFDLRDGRWAWDDKDWFLMQQQGRVQEFTGHSASYDGSNAAIVLDHVRAVVEQAAAAVNQVGGEVKRKIEAGVQ